MFSKSPQNINSFYMVLERLVVTIANFVVFTVLARKLGPESTGIFSLTQSILLVGWPIALFINEQVLIRQTLDSTQNTNSIFKHALTYKIFLSAITYVLSILLASIYFDESIVIYVSIFCMIHFFNFDIIFFSYFRAHQKSKQVFKIRALIILLFSTSKVILLINNGNLLIFFILYVAEAIVLGFSAYIAFIQEKSNSQFYNAPYSRSYFTSIAKASIPLMLSAVVIMLYSRVDQFMIKNILGTHALGQYSVGVKLSEASTILLATFFTSRFPKLLELHKINYKQFEDSIIRNLQIAFFLGSCMLVMVYFLSETVITLLFGTQFSQASPVLVIHMIGAIFIYYGMINTQWLIAEKMEYLRFPRVLVGLIINIFLNLFWIERFGIVGAAYSTVISQLASNVLFNLLNKKTRVFFRLEIISFNILMISRIFNRP